MAFLAQPASPHQGYPATPHCQSSLHFRSAPPQIQAVPNAMQQLSPQASQEVLRTLPAAAPAAPAPAAPQCAPQCAPRTLPAQVEGPKYGTVRASKLTGRTESDWSRALVFSYTLALLGCCGAATVLCLQLGMDPDVVFWIGRWGLLALLVPVFILAMFVLHLIMLGRGVPNRRVFIWAIVAPSVFFCIMGGVFMQQGSYLYGQLKSNDCSGSGYLPEKKKLQDAYDSALSVYGACVTRLYRENGQEPLESRPTLFGCDEWDNLHDELDLNGRETDSGWPGVYKGRAAGNYGHRGPEERFTVQTPSDMRQEWGLRWSYLASVEADHVCSGWCESGGMLWTSYEPGPGGPRVGGRCSSYVAQKFLTVSHLGRVILFVQLLTVIITFVYYIRLGNALIKLGYK